VFHGLSNDPPRAFVVRRTNLPIGGQNLGAKNLAAYWCTIIDASITFRDFGLKWLGDIASVTRNVS